MSWGTLSPAPGVPVLAEGVPAWRTVGAFRGACCRRWGCCRRGATWASGRTARAEQSPQTGSPFLPFVKPAPLCCLSESRAEGVRGEAHRFPFFLPLPVPVCSLLPPSLPPPSSLLPLTPHLQPRTLHLGRASQSPWPRTPCSREGWGGQEGGQRRVGQGQGSTLTQRSRRTAAPRSPGPWRLQLPPQLHAGSSPVTRAQS